MRPFPVSIIGAGIGGLVAALALARRGFTVDVYEQAAELGEIGAGLHLSPNGLKVMHALGLGDALAAIAARPRAIVTRHYASGEPNFEAPLDAAFEARFGAPFYSLHRADLHAALTAAARHSTQIGFHLGHRLVALEERDGSARLAFANGARATSPLVVGADGVHSAVRAALLGDADTRFTGHVAYRGTVASDALPAGLVEHKLNLWVGPGRHVVAYPVRRGELINYVALIEEDGWHDESWTTRADAGALVAGFAGWHHAVRALVETTLDGECYKWALLGRQPMTRWSTAHSVLLGDAAHPMVPYLAQGAVMATEDGWALAACLATESTLDAAVGAYETLRVERANAIQAAAWEQGQLSHAVGRDAAGDEFRGGRFADPGWIYGYDVVEHCAARNAGAG